MALTLTEKFRYTAGGKRFMYVEITDDEATSTFTAASFGFNQVEYVANMGFKYNSDVANISVMAQHMRATTDGLTVEMGVPANAGTIKKYLLIGW